MGQRLRLLGRSRAVPRRRVAAGGADRGDVGHRGQYLAEILQPWLRPGRPGDRGHHRRAVRRLGAAGSGRRRGAWRKQGPDVPCLPAPSWRAAMAARSLLGRRLVFPGKISRLHALAPATGFCQHRGGPGAVLRPTVAERGDERAFSGQPARDEPPAMEGPLVAAGADLGGLVHDQRQLRRLGDIRPQRRLPGLCHADGGRSRPGPGRGPA